MPVTLGAFGAWTAGGVTLWRAGDPGAPSLGAAEGPLGPWPDAPSLERAHPRARRPARAAVRLVQLAHALLEGPALDGATTAVVLGSRKGSSEVDLDFARSLAEKGPAFGSPSSFVYTLATAAPAEVSIALALRGPLLAVSAGAASGMTAVSVAVALIARGETATALCGVHEQGGRGHELIALLRLERDGEGPLIRGSHGFSPGEARATEASSLLALLEGASRGHQSSPEGFWARVEVAWRPHPC